MPDLTLPEPRTPDPARRAPAALGHPRARPHRRALGDRAARAHPAAAGRGRLTLAGARRGVRPRARRGPGAHVLRRPSSTTPAVDAVYVASPHSHHRDHALLALRAGKHVLVEKAFTRNAAEARELVAAAGDAGVLLMEAMWTRYLPHTDVVRRVLEDGLLGDVHRITADYGVRAAPGPVAPAARPRPRGRRAAGPGHLSPVVRLVRRGRGRPPAASDERPGRRLARRDGCGRAGQRPDRLRHGAGAAVHVDAHRLRAHGAGVRLARPDRGGRPVLRPGRRHPDRRGAQRHVGRQPHPRLRRPVLPGGRARHVRRGRSPDSPLLPLDETVAILETADEIRRQVGVVYPGEA